ncbi:MAG TPA: hypothetical protein VLH79_15775, partial [Chthonomonadales bacterium]|nr:hypothetical protein [Chthonomonadales bacterium]
DALKSPDWYWWLYGSHLAFTMWCYTVAYRHARRAALEGTPPSDFCALTIPLLLWGGLTAFVLLTSLVPADV